MKSKELQILDTTLRDGSYIIDFQFTAEDTALIVSSLAHAGIPLIEVAHGLGLGAARAGKGQQAATDEDYLKAAVHSAGNAQVGAFFIPGIGIEDDIRLAADCGIHFIRMGTNVNEVDQSETHIALAKSLGLTVFSNLMKSYAVSPEKFAGYVSRAEGYGTDYLCIVDSAGGMLPEDVKNYMTAAQSAAQVPLCFHGHNNLSMSVANSIQAVDSGAVIVDASLQGMGRSEGNAITEVLVSILQKRGLLQDIDVHSLLDISEAFIRPLLKVSGYSGLGVVSGNAKFHSSFLNLVLEVSQIYQIDPRDLILKVTEYDQVNASRDTVETAAQEITKATPRTQIRFNLAPPLTKNETDLIPEVLQRAKELKEKSRKLSLPSVLNIVVSPYEGNHVSPFVETAFGCALSNIMLDGTDSLDEILHSVDGVIDYILLDPGTSYKSPEMESTIILLYSDAAMWARSAVNHLTQLLGGSVVHKNITVQGIPELVEPATHLLNLAKASINTNSFELADGVLALSPRTPIINTEEMKEIPTTSLLYDGGIGSLSQEALGIAAQRGQQVVRIDMRPTLAATALELIQTRQLVHESMGRDTWNGVGVVAGGLIGAEGEVIVDHIQRPTRVIGVADGRGGILSTLQSNEASRLVQQAIAEKQLGASRKA